MLEIQTKNVDPDIVILEVNGRITMGRDSKQLEWSTDNLVRENRKKIVFDLSGVSHIDSTGIGIIVMAAGQIQKAGGKLRVCAQGQVEQVLRMTNVDKVVNLCPSVAAAMGDF
jgi:anti-anti-sigma factor